MAGITLEVAQNRLQQWLDAEAALAGVLAGKIAEYEIEGRKVRRHDVPRAMAEIRPTIDYWQGWVNRLSGRRRVAYAVRA